MTKILGYPARAVRGMRNRSQRCSTPRLTLARNQKPLCGSLGAFTDKLKIRCGGKHGLCNFRHKPHLQFSSGSLARRGERHLPKLAQAIADVFVIEKRLCTACSVIFFVVDTRYHFSFVVASCILITPSETRSSRTELPVHMAFPCNSFMSGEGRNNGVLRSLAQPWVSLT